MGNGVDEFRYLMECALCLLQRNVAFRDVDLLLRSIHGIFDLLPARRSRTMGAGLERILRARESLGEVSEVCIAVQRT